MVEANQANGKKGYNVNEKGISGGHQMQVDAWLPVSSCFRKMHGYQSMKPSLFGTAKPSSCKHKQQINMFCAYNTSLPFH
jgi:hypothetical protein